MGSSLTVLSGRHQRIEDLVNEVIRRASAGGVVDSSSLLAENRDLMPELGERLSTLDEVLAASEIAAGLESSPSELAARARESEFLREALPDYQILGEIHRGGQGVVLKALQLAAGRMVALKLPLGGPFGSPLERERFGREVRLVAELNHQGIVKLYDAGLAAGRPYFSMEYVDGIPIDEYVLNERPSVENIVRLFLKVVSAAHHAHTRGIVHRDLKPHNILVTLEGEPRILDFGLARALTIPNRGDRKISLPGAVIGTMPYLSPEQAAGDGDVQATSDVYALAIVLYELLTDAFPYPVGGSLAEVRRHIHDTPPHSARLTLAESPLAHDPDRTIPRDLDAILLKALRKEPEERYSSAAALAEDLERFLAGEIVHARMDEGGYVLRKLVRRYRGAAAVAALLLCTLVGALVGVSMAWRHAADVALTATTALEMSGRVALGAVERDAGRVELAEVLFSGAERIGEALATNDPAVQRQLHSAWLQKATLNRREGRLDDADKYVRKLVEQADRMTREFPHDAEWRRLLAMTRRAQGNLEFAKKNWTVALPYFDDALAIFREFAERSTPALSARTELGQTLSESGATLTHAGNLLEARERLLEARFILRQVCHESGDALAPRLDALMADLNLAASYIAHVQTETDRRASALLEQIDWALTRVEAAPDADEQRAAIVDLRESSERAWRRINARIDPFARRTK